LAWLRAQERLALMGEILDAFLTAFDADNTKRCAKCWRYLPLTDFGHDGRTRDHLTYRCNTCRAVVETHTSTIDHHGDI
jgi:hypothetical protein